MRRTECDIVSQCDMGLDCPRKPAELVEGLAGRAGRGEGLKALYGVWHGSCNSIRWGYSVGSAAMADAGRICLALCGGCLGLWPRAVWGGMPAVSLCDTMTS